MSKFQKITATAHGLTAADVGKPFKNAAGDPATDADAEGVWGVLAAVVNANDLYVRTAAGRVTGLQGLAANTLYRPDASGGWTATAPSALGKFDSPVLRTGSDATIGEFTPAPPREVIRPSETGYTLTADGTLSYDAANPIQGTDLITVDTDTAAGAVTVTFPPRADIDTSEDFFVEAEGAYNVLFAADGTEGFDGDGDGSGTFLIPAGQRAWVQAAASENGGTTWFVRLLA